jgi:hypothetical protein
LDCQSTPIGPLLDQSREYNIAVLLYADCIVYTFYVTVWESLGFIHTFQAE